ncbi:MAG: sigma-54-dependent Fis family transcriptional regulator [Deltaproteobacteria bacterium]|nr:sigma-54-dependent Fis family transcriptional regulator [Deltaproteobacteria bacterium]
MADILIVDDQDRYTELCKQAIPEHRYRGPARSWREAAEILARSRGRVDLVLLDVHFDIPPENLVGYEAGMPAREVERLRGCQGLEILGAMRSRYPDLPVILMTSRDELALEGPAERLHAEEYTYFLDDDYVDARSLQAQISSIIDARQGQEADGPVFWGRSFAMRRLRQRLKVLARGRLPVVLQGPTGTGKSLIARHFLHPRSGRSGRFVAVDLSTLPTELMAAHLFGSVKGAYTGSVSDRVGAFETADGGTLLLDEIANLTEDAQKMLLSVLQEGTVTRLGDLRERPIDVKLVAATNEDLAGRVRSGEFRADLYMRLNPAAAVRLPSLKERSLDLDRFLVFCIDQALNGPYLRGLVDAYRKQHGVGSGGVQVHAGGTIPEPDEDVITFLFPERVMRLLRRHAWPGNLREFAMTVENAVLFALSEMIGVQGGDRVDVIQVRPKLVRDLLANAPSGEVAEEGDGWVITVSIQPEESLNKVSLACEQQYFRQLYLREKGDFGAMAQVLLGDESHARKVQLRFNQIGLKVRELKGLLR